MPHEKVPGLASVTVPKESAFSLEEYKDRLNRVRKSMEARDLDVFVVFTPENIYYLSGYQTPGYYCYQCLFIPREGEPIHLSRCQEETNVRGRSWIEKSVVYLDHEDPVDLTATTLRSISPHGKVGLEKASWFLTVAHYERLQSMLPAVVFTDGSGIVEDCRVIKSDSEIQYIRKAAQIAVAGMQAGIEAIHEGATEDEVAAAILHKTTMLGSEYAGLPVFVASGYRSSMTHATWSGRRIEKGDPVLLEIPGCVKRYAGALMRCAVVGPPSTELTKMSETSIAALETLLKAIRPGRPLNEVWQVWADVIAGGGFFNLRRPGYSIGVNFPPDWGEGHILCFRRDEKRELQPNMTFHTPSLAQVFGVAQLGNSETIRVTQQGCECLTDFDRRLFIR